MLFCPSTEPENSKNEIFVLDDPWKLVQSGKIANRVPYAIGITDNEGSFYSAACNNYTAAPYNS